MQANVIRWLAFTPYILASLVQVIALTFDNDALARGTKILLMPLLACALVVLAVKWPRERRALLAILLASLLFSWIGDEAAVFFPFTDELPVMLGAFGVAHILYLWLFNRHLAVRGLPLWSLVFVAWWVGMLVLLLPSLGSLLIAVAVYGLVLGGTAASAARCHPVIAIGGLLFLASDTILAGRIFAPSAMPDWTSPLVMLTYCAGQGLIVAGVVLAAQLASSRSASALAVPGSAV